MIKVYIDGEAGTTGLQIRERLAARADIDLLQIDPERRKDRDARAQKLNEADFAILCLPDEASREAVSLIENPDVGVIDASTAYRVDPDWVYGFPEMAPEQRQLISGAKRVSNPGCYPTGMIALTRPLVEAGLLPKDWPVTINAVSGYSGGGKGTIAEFEDEAGENYSRQPFRLYGLTIAHKHVPEMQTYTGLSHPPLFSPAVGRYYKGMLVEMPLQLWALPGKPSVANIHETLSAAYEGAHFVEVASLEESASLANLDPEDLNGTNRMKLFVFASEKTGQARLVAQLDNLGKGASGQAVQCLNIMAGVDEALGLE